MEGLPAPVLALQVDAGVVPVLPLLEVRQAHPALDELLRRHDEPRPRTV